MKIKDIFHFEKGSLQSTKATPGDYDFITAASDWKTHNEFTHDCEALIFAAAASGSLGRTHYVNGKFISSDLCFIITPKDPDKYPVDLKFYHLIFEAFKDEIVRNTKSGTSKESIGLTVFGKYELPYYDIDKQINTRKKFVNAQDSTNKIDTELNHQLEILKQLRQAFLKEAFQGQLVAQHSNEEPASELLAKINAEKERLVKEKKIKKQKPMHAISEDEIPFEIPDSWYWCRIDYIADIGTGATPLTSNDSYYKNGTIPWITSSATNNLFINEAEKHITQKAIDETNCKVYPPGTLVVAMYGQGKTRGQISELLIHAATNQACATISFYLDEIILRKYVKLFFQKIYLEIRELAYGGAQPNLNLGKIKNTLVPIPPLTEQHRIVSKLDMLIAYCDELEKGISESQLENELLLKQVLTESLGLTLKKVEPIEISSKKVEITSKFDPNTTLMEIVELLKKHGKLHAEELWKMSKYPNDIDAFYAELKKQIELNKVVKESNEKGYLELV
ncbi:restriction endonuclease subunit S [Echinicola strongylocentroti]|nr:restriction endonuclease subunit S [Echinicola strongylocentroti]